MTDEEILARRGNINILSENIADEFFERGKDTHEIALRYRMPESTIYNTIHKWREAGR